MNGKRKYIRNKKFSN
ncbi:hypothetical protein BG0334 [Borreliella bavariensis PBi]|uniref:Uncharacterized protein n=1 Tax=Borrelia garinii subsp. bavariensis (strain ATCC BAA-2496 / DSM 23469 / PBi) TaxID=290434 RepID=A0A7I6GW42_BORGP|nr:hypothetical protein BG0334 [Borreliella bavariensis PBi]